MPDYTVNQPMPREPELRDYATGAGATTDISSLSAQERLDRAREQFETWASIPFNAQEVSMRIAEREAWEARVLHELRTLLGARATCDYCGTLDGDPHAEWCVEPGA